MRASAQGRSWPRPAGLSARAPPASAIDIPIDAPIAVHNRLRVFFSITPGSIRPPGRCRQGGGASLSITPGNITLLRGPDGARSGRLLQPNLGILGRTSLANFEIELRGSTAGLAESGDHVAGRHPVADGFVEYFGVAVESHVV